MMSETDSEPVAIDSVSDMDEGERVRVEYDSAYGGRQELTGEVHRVETEVGEETHGGIFHVYVRREGDEYPSRRLVVMAALGEIEVQGKNGARWNRISGVVADSEVFRENAGEDPEPVTDGGDSPESLANAVSEALASSDIALDRVSVSVDEVNADVTVQGNGAMAREDWTELRDAITDALDAAGFAYRAKEQWAFVEVTGREVMTDGGEPEDGEELETRSGTLPKELRELDFQNVTGVDARPSILGDAKRFRRGNVVMWTGEDPDDAEPHGFQLSYSQVHQLADLFGRMSEDIAVDEDRDGEDGELMTDGGVALAPDGGSDPSPDGPSVDPHREVKLEVVDTEPVIMASTVGEDGQYLAIWRDADADDGELEKYHLVMELAEYVDVDPYTTLDEDPGGVGGEGVALDLWTPKQAMTDGGCVVSDGSSELETEVTRALSDAGVLHAVELKPRGSGVTVSYTGPVRERISDALDAAGLANGYGRETTIGPDAGDISGTLHVSGVQNRGDGGE